MAEGELGFEINFGHGAVEAGQVEKRVVAEAAGAAGGFEDAAFDGAFGGVEGLAVAGGDEDAAIVGGAAVGGDAGEALQQDHVVPDIGVVVGVGRVDETGVGSEARGADAGRAVKGVDLEAGVIGEDERAGCEMGVVDGLEGGVGGEGCAVFFGRIDGGEAGKWFDGDVVGDGGGAEVAQFSLAGGGGEEAESHAESVTGAHGAALTKGAGLHRVSCEIGFILRGAFEKGEGVMTAWYERRWLCAYAMVLAMGITAMRAHAAGPVALRVDNLKTPLGLDDAKPSFSWQLDDPTHGAKQTAYAVQVATSAEGLRAGKADVWDSGRVGGDAAINVRYAGSALKASTRYWWRVTVWGANGKAYASSEPVWWETGLVSE